GPSGRTTTRPARLRRGGPSAAVPCPASARRPVFVESRLVDALEASVASSSVDVIPLGGVGEFGMNMLLVACGGTGVLIDAGVMFPDADLFGVDLVIPDLSAIDG